MHVSNYINLEDFKDYFNFINIEQENYDHVWREQHNEKAAKTFYIPIQKFLTDYRQQHGLFKVAYSEGHKSNFSHRWNKFVDNPDPQSVIKLDVVKDMFSNMITGLTMNYYKEELTQDFYEKKFIEATNYINAGNFTNSEMPSDMCKCYECAQAMKLTMKNWKPEFNVFKKMPDGTINYREFTIPESCLEEKAVEVTVNFPTGELVYADWFKIPQFTNIVEYNGKDKYNDDKSLNYVKGRIFTTKHYAEKHNFICISVGNSSPEIYQYNNQIIVGEVPYYEESDDDEEDEKNYIEYMDKKEGKIGGYEKVGKVCTDFWGVSIIDKQVLIDIIAQTEGDAAVEIVNAYTKGNRHTLKVEPGQYTFAFHGDYNNANDYMNNDILPKDLDKMLVIYKDQLKPVVETKSRKKKM